MLQLGSTGYYQYDVGHVITVGVSNISYLYFRGVGKIQYWYLSTAGTTLIFSL